MSESIHGHDVLDLIGSRAEPWPLAEFQAQAAAQFGPAAQFHNCHQGGFSLEHLLAFFASRDKIKLTADSVALGSVAACQH